MLWLAEEPIPAPISTSASPNTLHTALKEEDYKLEFISFISCLRSLFETGKYKQINICTTSLSLTTTSEHRALFGAVGASAGDNTCKERVFSRQISKFL